MVGSKVLALGVACGLLAAYGVAGAGGAAARSASGSQFDPGVGSAAALSSPACDPQTKRIRLPLIGAPPCVKPWKSGDDNGGATAQGVTKDAIKVVVLWAPPSPDSPGGAITNQVTNKAGDERDAMLDTAAVLDTSFQLWGRKVDWQFVRSSGTDEAAQRADAVTVAAMKPFAVFDYAQAYNGGGGAVFDAALYNKVPVVPSGRAGVPSAPVSAQETNAPIVDNAVEWARKALVGRNAKWAGDQAMRSQKRVFGVIYPDNAIDIAGVRKELAAAGARVAADAAYPTTGTATGTPAAGATDLATTIVTKFKSAGVTTIINFADGVTMTPALTRAATKQDYHPEWMVTGFAYSDLDVVARLADQSQVAHAFGLIWFPPDANGAEDPFKSVFQWYWGADKGTYSAGAFSLLDLYQGLHLAGPKLTQKTFVNGRKSLYPPTGGAYDGQVTTYETKYENLDSVGPRGSAIGWFDVDTTGPSQLAYGVGKGVYRYLNGAKRYIGGKFPKGEPKLFDRSNSIVKLDATPPAEVPPDYPCTNCPVNGGGPAASNLGS
jgi:hypothetical protein